MFNTPQSNHYQNSERYSQKRVFDRNPYQTSTKQEKLQKQLQSNRKRCRYMKINDIDSNSENTDNQLLSFHKSDTKSLLRQFKRQSQQQKRQKTANSWTCIIFIVLLFMATYFFVYMIYSLTSISIKSNVFEQARRNNCFNRKQTQQDLINTKNQHCANLEKKAPKNHKQLFEIISYLFTYYANSIIVAVFFAFVFILALFCLCWNKIYSLTRNFI